MQARGSPAWMRALASRPDGRLRHLHARVFGRPFSRRRARRVLVLFERGRISQASVHPFVAHADAFARRHDADVRLLPTDRALADGLPRGLAGATHVVAQSWLTDPPEKHAALARLLAGLPDGTVTAYLDAFANADIRLARTFRAVDLYFRKSLFVDPQDHLRPTAGHTNLSAFYGALYGIDQPVTDWQVPSDVLSKLRLAPNFLTAPGLRHRFLGPAPLPQTARDIDLHARLGGTAAGGWYGAMRRDAARRAAALPGLNVAQGAGVGRRAFMAELRRAKVCFSPFGYGEVCWRDMEAMAAGAVLLKPDMAHLRTAPDLYRDGETYVACRWDFADLEDRLADLLADPDRRARIAGAAFAAARRYLAGDGPVDTYGALFAPRGDR